MSYLDLMSTVYIYISSMFFFFAINFSLGNLDKEEWDWERVSMCMDLDECLYLLHYSSKVPAPQSTCKKITLCGYCAVVGCNIWKSAGIPGTPAQAKCCSSANLQEIWRRGHISLWPQGRWWDMGFLWGTIYLPIQWVFYRKCIWICGILIFRTSFKFELLKLKIVFPIASNSYVKVICSNMLSVV